MHDYSIQPARPEHVRVLPEIERAAAEGFPEHLMPRELRGSVQSVDELEQARSGGRLWVALSARGGPVGFAVGEHAGDAAMLAEVDVHPDHQGHGVGRRLIEAVVVWARREKKTALALTTFAGVPWNGPFYERLGFRTLDQDELSERLASILESERRSGLQDRVAMSLDLTDA
ncbi:MAG: GNAT family N-acetyltransferase [Bacteroidota bacterium]